MDTLRPIAAVVVGLVFVVAGASKLSSRESWRSQAVGLRAPTWTIPVVPWLELALGALLIAQFARVPVALASAALLVAFTALILLRLRAGQRPPCACFGAWSATPIGAKHVARNVVLFALAIVAALG